MTRLLGYQGIAVVIEELLKVIKSLVISCTNAFITIVTYTNIASVKCLVPA